jgi:nucleoside-diphosphate-sugar epimerase
MTSTKVCVTGASGYVASWVVKYLLEQGHIVHATVRELNNQAKVGHLHDIAQGLPGQLRLFAASLMKPGSFDEAIQGVDVVIHMASPFFITSKDAENELVLPAKEGTRNVLQSVNACESVKRVVLTSSVAAIVGDAIDAQLKPDNTFTESDWNETSSVTNQPYSFSKTVAEKLAWEMNESQSRWDLIVINPPVIFGPALSKRTDSTSFLLLKQVADGTYKLGSAEVWFGVVDVRDVANAHVHAAFTKTCSGRHILASQMATLMDIAKILEESYPKQYSLPKFNSPKWLFWCVAPVFGFQRSFVSKNVGFSFNLDTSYAKKDLAMAFLPLKQSVLDHFKQILDDGLLYPA